MMKYKDFEPKISPSAVVLGGSVIGDVILEKDVNIWFNATVRGDMANIVIKEGTNIQDNAVVHTDTLLPTYIGKMVTVGHSAIIHACTIEDNCLIGMGSIILNKAVIGEAAMVAAGTLVPPGKVVPPRTLVMGSPMRIVRELTDEEIEKNIENSRKYIKLSKEYAHE